MGRGRARRLGFFFAFVDFVGAHATHHPPMGSTLYKVRAPADWVRDAWKAHSSHLDVARSLGPPRSWSNLGKGGFNDNNRGSLFSSGAKQQTDPQ